MAEKKRYKAATMDDLYPMGFDEARKASREQVDTEYMAELQNKLPPELRFGGEFGLMSALGYGKDADSRAQIRNYTTRGRGLPSILGAFTKSPRGLGVTPEEAIERNYLEPSALEKSRNIEYMSSPPDRDITGGKGISVFHPIGTNEAERAYASKEGYLSDGKRYTYPETVAHELSHIAFDSPAFLDFVADSKRNRGHPFSAELEHYFIDSVSGGADSPKARERYAKLNEDFKQWLTPEKQKKYGVRLPIPAAQPRYAEESKDASMLDKLIEFIQGK